MKWNNIKNIMIGFLIFMNVFLLVIITATTIQKSYIPQEVTASAISVIEKAGFELNHDIFPEKYHSLPTYRAQFYSASDLSELFFKRQIAFRTDEESLVGNEGIAELIVNDNYFSYDSGYSPSDNFTPKMLKKALSKIGFDMSGAVYDAANGCFYKMYEDLNLFNMSIEAKLDSDGNICYVKAHWPKTLIKGERNNISFIESSAKLKKYFPQGGTIDSIELGYALHSSGGNKFLFKPTWRVSVNGNPLIIE